MAEHLAVALAPRIADYACPSPPPVIVETARYRQATVRIAARR
jgi:hypothetical protein